jgi:hypothetical protein
MMSEHEWRQAFSNRDHEGSRRTAACPSVELLAGYAEGRLVDSEREVLEIHLSDCGYCLGQVRFLLRSESLEATPQVPMRLLDLVRSPRPAERRVPHTPARVWLVAAASLLLVVVSVRFAMVERPQGASPGGVVGTESPEAEAGVAPVRSQAALHAAPTVIHPREGQRVNRNALVLAWEPVSQALEYSVQLMDGEGKLVWEDRSEALSTTVPLEIVLEPGRRYFMWVAAHLRSGLRARSPALAFEIAPE